MNLSIGEMFLIVILIIAILFPFYWVYLVVSGKHKNTELGEMIAKNNERRNDLLIAQLGTGYIDSLISRYGTAEIPEHKIEEITQWTAAYGDEEARRMYREKYCNNKIQENSTTGDKEN